MRILVVGGAGKMGCIAVQDLANDPRVDEVILADVQMDQAQIVADTIGSPKVHLQKVDFLKDPDGFTAGLRGADACLNATNYTFNISVMEACLAAGVGYLDLGGLFHVTRQQLQLHDRFLAAGLSAVLGMGTAPGITNVQARFGVDQLDTVESIKIYDGGRHGAIKEGRFTYAVPTIIDEITLEPIIYRQGKFVSCQPLSEFEDYWFTHPIGLLPVHLSLHSEVATLPLTYHAKGLKECFFKIHYWGMPKEMIDDIQVLVDYGFSGRDPIQLGDREVAPRQVMMALLSGHVPPITDYLAPAETQPPDWVQEMATEVRGQKDGQEVVYKVSTLTCKSALPTGVAPAVAAIWMAEGRLPPGAHAPEQVIDPLPFFKELQGRDIATQVSVTQMLY